ncbi:MAG: HEPN domain-containing protein, partial [Spirochaetales bacterium]|nr:HEPN domain-containing protein [Spirochaetales bacterium]
MKRQAEAWLNSAKDDLLTIQEIIDNPLLTNIIAYHAQQAIEKSLKAFIETTAEDVPRIHNLITLRGIVGRKLEIEIDSNSFDQINELYVDSRYPTDIGYLPEGKPSIEKAMLFQKTAEDICRQIEQALKKIRTVP